MSRSHYKCSECGKHKAYGETSDICPTCKVHREVQDVGRFWIIDAPAGRYYTTSDTLAEHAIESYYDWTVTIGFTKER